MKKILKRSLFIIAFCLLLLFLNNLNVQAVDADGNITTVQELQEFMGAKEYSIIEGTTLKITNDFTWEVKSYGNFKIPEVTIDFNGKKITINTNRYYAFCILEGKFILKDTMGTSGGIYYNGSFGDVFQIYDGAELIVENGQYTDKDDYNDMFHCLGGVLKIKNGEFKGSIIRVQSGTLEIEDGNFESYSGPIIKVEDTMETVRGITVLVNGGKFTNETGSVLLVYAYGKIPVNISLSGRRNGKFVCFGVC